MNYLLLGGAGFIGTHLAKDLIDEGHEVTVVDSLETSKRPDSAVAFIQGNILELDLSEVMRRADIVYYLAGSVGVKHIDQNPSLTLFNNIELMTKLVPLFEEHQKKVIFSSTSEVYGEGPFSEGNNLSIGPPHKLRWGYACAKLMTEFMIKASSFPSVIIRFFNVVGPGQSSKYGMVLPNFIEKAKKGEPLVVYGDGEQIRCFCHIKDAVQGLRLLETEEGIFNIGKETETPIKELALLVLELTESDSVIEFRPYEKDFSKEHGDIMKRVPVLDAIRNLGYAPKHTLTDIIKEMI